MTYTQLLHLSDLHLKADANFDEILIREKLIEDISGAKARGQEPSAIIFSGDLVYAADSIDSYDLALDLLKKVSNAARTELSTIYPCPGNHDLSRSLANTNLTNIKIWRESAKNTETSNSLLHDIEFNKYLEKAFENWNSLTQQLGHKNIIYKDNFCTTYKLKKNLFIVSVNTATLSVAGTSNEMTDFGNLFIPEESISKAISSCNNDGNIICIGHHPLNWLNPSNHATIRSIIAEKCSSYFFGHMHDPIPVSSTSWGGEIIMGQSGALYYSRKFWNGYTVATISEVNNYWRMSYRRWWEPRRSFSKSEDLGDDGVYYSSELAKNYYISIEPKTSPTKIEDWRKHTLAPYLEREYNNSFTDQNLESVFIEPEFETETPYETETDGRVGSKIENISLSDLIDSDANYVISSGSETGKSSVLRKIALIYGKKEATTLDWIYPVIISFDAVRNYEESIKSLIRQRLPDLPHGVTSEDLLKSGLLLVLVDDVEFSKQRTRETLMGFIEKYPSCRYVLTSSTPFVETSALKPEISAKVPFSRVRMRPISPAKMRSLIECHGTAPLEADKMLARVIRDAESLNVPLTPVTGTFLIQIFLDDPDSILVNQASLTERYVELILQKYAPREVLPGAFDFKNKKDILSYVAERMTVNGNYSPSYNESTQWIIEYLNHYGFSYSASDILNYFIESRIIERTGDVVRFRLKMFYEFFTASRMIDEDSFKDYILDDSRYLTFINEISFYASLHRKDLRFIEKVDKRLAELAEELYNGDSTSTEDLIWDFKVPGKQTTEDELDSIYNSVASEETAKIVRSNSPISAETGPTYSNQDIVRDNFADTSSQWYAHLLLLSSLVKHTELIPEQDKKRILSNTLDAWVEFTTKSLSLSGTLAKHRKITLNGVTYISTLPKNLPIGEVARRVSLSMPAAAARFAGNYLGSEKLTKQLLSGIGSDEEPAARQFIKFAILSDFGSANISSLAPKLERRLRNSRFLSHVLARKLYEVAVRFRLPKDQLDKIRSLSADIYVNLEGVPKNKASSRRSRIIEGMTRQRRQIEISRRAHSRPAEISSKKDSATHTPQRRSED